jgi:3-oxoacyl-[acyl-carrier-protein] synthase-3
MVGEAYLNELAASLGGQRVTVEEDEAAGRLHSPASVLREAGFGLHHMAAEGERAYDLARACVQGLPGARACDALLYATTLPLNANLGSVQEYERTGDVKHVMDFPVSHLQADLGLERAFVVGVTQQACTGLLGSVRLARGLLAAEPDLQRILCLTADRFPPGARYEQSYSLISDGAACCVVSREPRGYRILACHALTNGALAAASDDETVGSFFTYTFRLIRETLERAQLSLSDVAWIVPQNMNVRAWQILARQLRFDFERVAFPSLPTAAHVISGDNVINLLALEQAGRLASGERLLLPMAGYGLNWQCLLLERV